MHADTLAAIRADAVAKAPRECAGFVLLTAEGEVYRACENRAEGNDHFIIAPEDFAQAEDDGQILAVVHSHPGMTARPSEADRAGCAISGLPWLIVSVIGGEAVEVREILPDGYKAPLIGREFFHGALDCYTLIRDWFERERGITIPDFARKNEWWNDGASSLYLDGYAEAGFERVPEGEPLQVGDVPLMQIRSTNGVPNHAGVLVAFTDIRGTLLHHMVGRRSEQVVYGGGPFERSTRFIVRHKELKNG
jgi:proteasome lid subunit RPN8/RPN11